MTLADFVDVTRGIAANARQQGEAFLPTFADPATRGVRVLEGAPEGGNGDEAREWAAGIGSSHYFLAQQLEGGVLVEEFTNGSMVNSARLSQESGHA